MGDERIASIIALPQGAPRALVGLLQGGGGAPKSHRHALWRRTAEGLAAEGLASVRLDWLGVGDSTGEAHFGFNQLPIDQALTVMRFAQEAVGVDTVGLAGNCMGARVSLQVAGQIPACRSMALIMLKPLSRAGRSRAEGLVAETANAKGTASSDRQARPLRRRSSAASLLKKVPALDSMARRAYWRMQWSRAAPLLNQISAVRKHGQVLIMEDGAEKQKGRLQHALNSLRRRDGLGPFELRDLPGGAIRVFDNIERQDFVVTTLIEWFDRTLPAAGAPSGEPSLEEAAESTG